VTDLSGRVALVTGGSRGIGRAIVEELARGGCRVAVVATGQAGAEEAAQAARGLGVEAAAFAADVRDPARATAVVEAVLGQWGRIDLLVNNAGITRDNLLMRMADEDIDAVIDIDLKAALYWCRAVARPMTKARAGCILNISSIVGLMGSAGQSNYAAAKAGLLGLTRSLAKELGGRGVRVNAIAPGLVETKFASAIVGNPMLRDHVVKRTPLARHAQPAEIAGAAVYLLSDAASFTTGAVLVVDGGMTAT